MKRLITDPKTGREQRLNQWFFRNLSRRWFLRTSNNVGERGKLFDINGNTVGDWRVRDRLPSE